MDQTLARREERRSAGDDVASGAALSTGDEMIMQVSVSGAGDDEAALEDAVSMGSSVASLRRRVPRPNVAAGASGSDSDSAALSDPAAAA